MSKSIATFTRTLTLTVATLLAGTGLAQAAEPAALVDAQTEGAAESPDRFDAAAVVEGQVNINTASSAELELLPGIGPSIAARIISYREQHKFEQRNHIMRVKGIGQKTFAKIKDHLVVDGETTLKLVK